MNPQLAAVFSGAQVDPGSNGINLDPQRLFAMQGFLPARRIKAAKTQIQLAECAKLWDGFLKKGTVHPFLMMEAFRGSEMQDFAFPALHRLAPSIFNEAMTRSDFTNLTTYVLDRMMFENYRAYPKTYEQFCKLHMNVRDFRAVERWQVDGGEGVWQRVGELGNFNRQAVATGKYGYQVYKYEKGDQISWESTINDDMSMFSDLPQRLALGGVRTIEQFALNLIAGAAGPKTSFYGSAINLVTGGTIKNIIDTSAYSTGTYTGAVNPPLSVISLILATGLFMNQMTGEGRPIDVAQDEIVVLVADGILYQTLMNIINTNQIVTTILGAQKANSTGAYPDIMMQAKNWLAGRIRPVFAPELRNIMTSNAATSWWLFAKPGSGRPAIELGFLQGYGEPQLYRKLPNTVKVGGGGAIDELGDFETMGTEFKGLVVFGGTSMDPRMTMASNGTGS